MRELTSLASLSASSAAEVLTAEQAQQRFGTDTGGALRQLAGAVRVTEPGQVNAVLLWANEHKQSVWPISGGRNFGYVTALPALNGALILDLSGLNEIGIFCVN